MEKIKKMLFAYALKYYGGDYEFSTFFSTHCFPSYYDEKTAMTIINEKTLARLAKNMYDYFIELKNG